ncbi:DUF3558 domain-containing protein [Amycolatopsis halotolerans]|uniref:DUF3558 domain-containing protein n=1 Tax=Amycolatopsis halotolerans TaxID=330083 RepID=A0ABV7QMP5_9PSEU
MKAQFVAVAAGVVAAVACVSGCSGGSGSGGSPASVSAPVSPSGTGKTLPYAGAPKVENPLPDSVLSAHPCDSALTPDQVGAALTQKPRGEHDDKPELGAQCHWINSDVGAGVSVIYVTKVTDGLSAVYANTKPQSTVWRPLSPIQGLPAVAHSTYSTEGSKSFCQVSVGISDKYTVGVSVNLSPAKVGAQHDPCDAATQVAGMVVTNLKQKAGA